MQRLRSTFKRSRTPTGAEMKSQSSLEVPKQVRSASFDEIQLEAKRQDGARARDQQSLADAAASSSYPRHQSSYPLVATATSDDSETSLLTSTSLTIANSNRQSHQESASGSGVRRLTTLRVPQLRSNQRSKSFDACGIDKRTAGSPSPSPVLQISGCYHCACVEEYERQRQAVKNEAGESPSAYSAGKTLLDHDGSDPRSGKTDAGDEDADEERGDNNDDDDDVDDDEDPDDSPEDEDEDDASRASSRRRVQTSPSSSGSSHLGERDRDHSPEIRVTLTTTDSCYQSGRRRSVASPKLSRQEALTSFPPDPPYALGTRDESNDDDGDGSSELSTAETETDDRTGSKGGRFVVRDIFLTVPELKRDRAASVDSCFNGSKNAEKSSPSQQGLLAVPQQSLRSKSVDIVLPTDVQTRYTALLPSNESRPLRGGREGGESGSGAGQQREPRSTPDWGPSAINGEHLWVPTAASGDFCYVTDCSKHGARLKCAACRVVAHACCATTLGFACKPSFRDVGVRQYREQTSTHHHWVHRRSQKGKCANCSKSFQSKLSFSSKEIVAVSCSWCKTAYHNKEACFNVQKIGENCDLGSHVSVIVPPSWIVKLPRKGSFKSSLRKSPQKKKSSSGGGCLAGTASTRKKNKDKEKDKDKEQGKLWIVKPIPTASVRPVLVFINPKSGGNQGAKLLQKFQWHLNPRQVFDLTQGGPKMGLELFKKVPNLRVLACGGDGTVGWVLSILDQIGASPPPAVGVLPLGTGNDLARALGWGGGYTDEPIAKILTNIGDSDTTLLDRWQLTVERNTDAPNDDEAGKGKESLPLNVVNNYFSLGVDAHIALEFHEAREAHPEKFNSRLRNKMFYGQMGGKDLVRRKWKDLSEFVTLECDGQDLTPKLKEHRVHAIVFLNIGSYGGGTHPWPAGGGGSSGGGSGGEPKTDDGLIEVVGLTTYQLPLLQAGGHGTCIAQCSKAKLVTTRTIPMQVDGEACRLLPSVISMSLLNKATMLAKRRNTGKPQQNVGTKLERLKLPVMRIKMSDYEAFHSDKERLKRSAVSWLPDNLDLDATLDLESLRGMLAKELPMDACCFLDSCTAERFFRIDRAQEQLHYVTDVAADALYVLEEGLAAVPSQDVDVAQPSPSDETSRHAPGTTTEEKRSSPGRLSPSDQTRATREPDQERRHSGRRVPEIAVPSKDIESGKWSGKIPPNGSSSVSKSNETPSATPSQSYQPLSYVSSRDRLFGLSAEVHSHGRSFGGGLLEKTNDGILRAAKTGDLQAMKDLHSRGYSLLSIDVNGQTALHLAARHGHKDIVRYLVACAPPTILNMVDNDKGQTALHKAAQQKRRSVCCMLVAGGATLTVRDRQGNTPRQLALNAEDRELAAYLESQEQFHLVTVDMENVL